MIRNVILALFTLAYTSQGFAQRATVKPPISARICRFFVNDNLGENLGNKPDREFLGQIYLSDANELMVATAEEISENLARPYWRNSLQIYESFKKISPVRATAYTNYRNATIHFSILGGPEIAAYSFDWIT